MEGTFQIVETYIDGNAKAVLTEDIFKLHDESADSYIKHEVHLTLGVSKPLVVWSDEIDSVIAVLSKAKELAAERQERFYADDVVPA